MIAPFTSPFFHPFLCRFAPLEPRFHLSWEWRQFEVQTWHLCTQYARTTSQRSTSNTPVCARVCWCVCCVCCLLFVVCRVCCWCVCCWCVCCLLCVYVVWLFLCVLLACFKSHHLTPLEPDLCPIWHVLQVMCPLAHHPRNSFQMHRTLKALTS